MVTFAGGQPVHEWSTLVDPETDFDDFNVMKHGIEPHQVKGAPKWSRVMGTVSELVGDNFAVAHSPFDRAAVDRACVKAGLTIPNWQWVDTMRVSRRQWPQFKTHGLDNICKELGIPLAHHHEAMCDARACGMVLVKAQTEACLSVERWRQRTMGLVNPLTGRERSPAVGPDDKS